MRVVCLKCAASTARVVHRSTRASSTKAASPASSTPGPSVRAIIAHQAKLFRRAELKYKDDQEGPASPEFVSRADRLSDYIRNRDVTSDLRGSVSAAAIAETSAIEEEESGSMLNSESELPVEEEPLEGLTSQVDVKPGDLVEYWPDQGKRCTAVVLKLPTAQVSEGLSALTRHLTIDDRGSIDYTEAKRYLMVVPGFMNADQLSWIKSTTPVSQGDRRLHQISKRAHEFAIKSESLRSEYAERLSELYQLLPEIVRKQAMPVSCAEAARIVFETEEVSPVQIHAVHASMMRDRVHFLPDTVRNVTVPIFRTRDPAQVKTIISITTAVRYRSPAYRSFLVHAKNVAAWGEANTTPDGPLMPVETPATLTWNLQDSRYIDFLLQATLERPDIAEVEIYTTPSATIVKDLGFFPDEQAKRQLVHKTLKKLGVLAPWDISMNRSPALALPGHGSSQSADKHQAWLDETYTESQLDLNNDGSKSVYLKDTLKDLRHDFEQMPVYTIDSESAEELDDGISLDKDGWMHVHIANPAAFMHPKHGLARIAQHRAATRYLDYVTYPMLPTQLVMRHFSLANRPHGTPVITTSFKLKPSGEIDQIKVRPGLIHNIIRTSYRAVDAALGSDLTVFGEPTVISAGWREEESERKPRDNQVTTELTEDNISDLKHMLSYLRKSQQYRASQGAIEFPDTGDLITSLETQPAVLPGMKPSLPRSTFYSGKLGVRFAFARADDDKPAGMSQATRIVSEAAILANHATALYCQEQNIPVMYRAAEFAMSPEERADFLAQRKENGVHSRLDLIKYQHLFRPTQVSLKPKRMDYVGLKVYMTITSPLRRFADLCGQWALGHHFRSSRDKSKDERADAVTESKHPLPLEQLEAMLPELERTMLAIKRRSVLAGQNVIMQLLEQKWQAGELNDPVEAVVLSPPRTETQLGYSATVPAWGNRRVLLKRTATEPLLKMGDRIQVIIEGLDHFDFNVSCKRVA